MDGIININKEKGYTSHDVVAVVRKILGYPKAGHTGTLDPQAEGVLPVCIGKATKLADYIMSEVKEYVAEVTLGITTDTEDATGVVLQQREVIFDEEYIGDAVSSFKGEIMQLPPMYSAIKIDGKKLYELARQGKEVERTPRKITIYDIRVTEFIPPNKINIYVVCSKGTYIRTLCKDIGEKLGCGANMSKLMRTRTGSFKIEDSITLDKLREYKESNSLDKVLIKIDEVLNTYPKVYVKDCALKPLYNGNIIYCNNTEGIDGINFGTDCLVYDLQNNFIGIYKLLDENGELAYIKPVKMFWTKEK